MSIINFENIKITTMTVVVKINGNIYIENVFPLLPISKLDIPNNYKNNKKFKIPWPGREYAGCIFSCKYVGITRGLIKSKKTKSFRNSVGIDICTSAKNVSAKLAKDKIQMCGPSSEEMAMETAQHIITHLINIQNELDYISKNITARDEVIKWLIRETKGEKFMINAETQEIIKLENEEYIRDGIVHSGNGQIKYNYKETICKWEEGDKIGDNGIVLDSKGQPYYRIPNKREKKIGIYPYLKLGDEITINLNGDKIFKDDKGNKINKVVKIPLQVIEVFSLKIPKYFTENAQLPQNIDSRIAKFLIRYTQDYAYHHVYSDFLENFKNIDRIYDKSVVPSLGNLNIAMINYSYSLGMNIDRWNLTQLIDGYKNYKATYNNTTDHHVTISVPYVPDKSEIIKRKCHNVSFMIYKSGIVTQSGPSPQIMKDIYYDFMNFINNHRKEIKLNDDKPFSLKFKPISSE